MTLPDLGVGMIYLQLLLLCSLAIFFSVFLSPLVNFFLTLALFIVGNLSSFTEDLIMARTSDQPLQARCRSGPPARHW